MNSVVKKSDIHSGYVVRLRSGELRMAVRAGNFTKILVAEDGSWNYLSGWDEDLNVSQGRKFSHIEKRLEDGMDDIVEVYGLVEGTQNYREAASISVENRGVIWQRPKPKKVTISEICKMFGCESIEIVQG